MAGKILSHNMLQKDGETAGKEREMWVERTEMTQEGAQ